MKDAKAKVCDTRSRRSWWPCTILLQSVPFMKVLRRHGEAHGPFLGVKKIDFENCGQPWAS